MKRSTKNRLSVAAVFSAGWFAFVLVMNMLGIDTPIVGEDSGPIWIAYFVSVGIISSLFLIQARQFGQQVLNLVLVGVLCLGVIGVIRLYISHGEIVSQFILAVAFAIIGYLFAITMGKME